MNNNIKRGVWVAVVLLGCLGLVVSAQGASFDCRKARTKVEHLICDNPELSKLDEELAQSFKSTIQEEAHAKPVREEQGRWITHRNYCESTGCLKALYRTRIQELADAPKFFSKKLLRETLTDASEKPAFDSEADKLTFMRKLVRAQKFAPPRPELSFESSDYCQQFFKDFTNGTGIEAVEPIERINDENDPRLEKWNNACEDKATAAEDAFSTLRSLGGPPYRHYQLELDGNPKNGKEEVFYTDYLKVDEGEAIGQEGYRWIDLEQCVVAGGGGYGSNGLALLPPNTYFLSLLVKYRGEHLAVGLSPYSPDYYEQHGNIYYRFDVTHIVLGKTRYSCAQSPDFHPKQSQ